MAGTSDNVITDYTIRNSNGEDVTQCFDNVECVKGTLRVTKAGVQCWTEGSTKTYDGSPLTSYHFKWYGIKGYDEPETGVKHTLTSSSYIKDVGSVEIQFEASLREDLRDKYEIISTSFGANVVEPAPLTVITDSGSKPYDGTPLTAEAHLEGLMSCDDATVTATGSITNEGQATNTYIINWGTTNPNNYKITEKLGTLSITGASGGSEPADLNPGKFASGSQSPDFSGSVSVVLQNKGDVFEGDTVVFTAIVQGDPSLVTIHWQKLAGSWKDIGSGQKLSLEANEANAGARYRVVLYGTDGSMYAEASFSFPAIRKKVPAAPEPAPETAASTSTSEPESEAPSAPEPKADQETESGAASVPEKKSEPAAEQEPDRRQTSEPETPAAEKPAPLPEPKDEPKAEPVETTTSGQELPATEEEPAATADLTENADQD